MSIVSWCGRIYQSTLYGGNSIQFKMGNIFLTFTPNPVSYFKVHNSLLKKDFRDPLLCETSAGKKEARKYCQFSNKNEFNCSKSLSKREKDVDLNKAKSTESEASNRELPKYKLEGRKKVSEKKKKIGNELKKFKIRDVISDHDLQIKINSILKYLEKGRKVSCEVGTAGKKNEFEKILKKLNDSKLKDYFVEAKMTPMLLYLTYRQKAKDKET